MVYPALLPLMRTPRLPAVDWTDAPRRFKWTRSVSPKDEIWFLRVCHHVLNAFYTYVCMGSERIMPLSLYLDTKYEWVVNFTLRPLYPWKMCRRFSLNRRINGSYSRSGSSGGGKTRLTNLNYIYCDRKSKSSEGNVRRVQNYFCFAPFYVKQLDVVARKARILVPLYGVWNMLLQ